VLWQAVFGTCIIRNSMAAHANVPVLSQRRCPLQTCGMFHNTGMPVQLRKGHGGLISYFVVACCAAAAAVISVRIVVVILHVAVVVVVVVIVVAVSVL